MLVFERKKFSSHPSRYGGKRIEIAVRAKKRINYYWCQHCDHFQRKHFGHLDL